MTGLCPRMLACCLSAPKNRRGEQRQAHPLPNARLDASVTNRCWGRRFVVNQSVNCISGSPDSPAGETIFPARRYITENRARSLRARARARSSRTSVSLGSYERPRITQKRRTEKPRRYPEEFASCFIIDFVGDINFPRAYQSPKFFIPRDRRDSIDR